MDDPKSGSLTDGTHPAVCRAPVEPLAVVAVQDRALAAITDGQVNGSATRGTRGMTAGLFPLPMMRRVDVPDRSPGPRRW